MATPVFSNTPRFNQKPLTIAQTLDMARFDVLTEANPATSSIQNSELYQQDPNLGTLWVKNVVHQVIRVGGKPIDFNFLFDCFWKKENMVTTKRLYNHYIGRPDFNIYAAASVQGASAGVPLTFQLIRENHAVDGTDILPAVGYQLVDKDNYLEYTITEVDTTVPFAAKITITPNGNFVGNINANTQYFISPAVMVGGESCQTITNSADSIGWSKEFDFLRLRRDWETTIDLSRGYRDKFQFAVIYDVDGKQMDSWVTKESQDARKFLRLGLNQKCFIGSPVTNTSLIYSSYSQSGAPGVDADHTGFYGIFPEVNYGGGTVIPYAASVGFDLESDGEPFMLYQDSVKRTDSFMVMHGIQFMLGMEYRSNKMVARQQVGTLMFDAYKRMGASSVTDLVKMGIKSWTYRDWNLDFKKWGALSDVNLLGSSQNSNTALWIPMDGLTENGAPIDPIEFYQYGTNEFTGGYEEYFVDQRNQAPSCEKLSGFCAQSLSMAVHGPELFGFCKPVADA
jgi:hypothetical protein